MKTSTQPPKTLGETHARKSERTEKPRENSTPKAAIDRAGNHLREWLSDPRSAAYFGRAFLVRADVLAHLITSNGTLAAIGAAHGISKQAVSRHAKLARRIFGIGQRAVDSAQGAE